MSCEFILIELGQKLVLPKPSAGIVEVHKILEKSGFNVAPVAYVDREKRQVTYGVLETLVRPSYTDGTQMYYSNPDEDPLAKILEKGRTGQGQRIAIPNWVRHVPTKSRFAVSCDEIHNFVVPEVVSTTSRLAEIVKNESIVFRVPTIREFQSAGEEYPHFGDANSWEWLYDSAWFGYRLFGGYRDSGGLRAVNVWLSDNHYDDIGFRLQAVSPSQKFSR